MLMQFTIEESNFAAGTSNQCISVKSQLIEFWMIFVSPCRHNAISGSLCVVCWCPVILLMLIWHDGLVVFVQFSFFQ